MKKLWKNKQTCCQKFLKTKKNLSFIFWLYKKNPLGEAIGFDACDSNGNIVAHYAAIPIELR